MQRGFSLVELSIVLVILGLLTGGVLAGQSLIHAAELRAVSTEFQRYETAVYTFRDKYFAQPGDMLHATKFWPTATNGTGVGRFPHYGAGARVWQHLSLAGLIEGSYPGTQYDPAGGACRFAEPQECPKSKMGSLGHLAVTNNTALTPPYGITNLSPPQGFLLYDGTSADHGQGIQPEDAWNIDQKFDDGKPGTGKMLGYGGGGFLNGDGWTGCAENATGQTYAVTSTQRRCRPYWLLEAV